MGTYAVTVFSVVTGGVTGFSVVTDAVTVFSVVTDSVTDEVTDVDSRFFSKPFTRFSIVFY